MNKRNGNKDQHNKDSTSSAGNDDHQLMLVRVMSDSGGNGQAHIVKEDGSEDWGYSGVHEEIGRAHV